ncbi:MAG: hypothetical protein GY868_11185 [Deltaproteobacteria bacterium]|nr:hypothetical protein [Deltaproteobacteria bacterium]
MANRNTLIILFLLIVFVLGRERPARCSDTEVTGIPEISATAPFSSNWLDARPVRNQKPLIINRRAGYTYTCHECHRDFKTPLKKSTRPIGEHRTMVFDHGLNVNCLSCHHPENRDVYRDHDFSEIPADQPVMLCRKCHGPVYRDWEAGIHGRLSGYWHTDSGPQTKLDCNQCHDPHQPLFKELTPMPPPLSSRFEGRKKGRAHE